MRIETERKLDFDDVLIRPKRSRLKTRAEVNLVRNFKLPHSKQTLTGVPVIAANMDSVGTFNIARALSEHQMFTAVHKYYSIEQWQDAQLPEHAFVTFGLDDVQKITDTLKTLGRDRLCLDIANGYTEMFVDFIRDIRKANPDIVLMAGNVATPDMTEALVLAGADIIKIGIGPGSVCTTRIMTGVGYPQLSAIIECADAAHGLGGLICAGGGCKTPGDVAKAFAAGADFVMLGGMLAGHTEALNDEQLADVKDGKTVLEYYGMSSAAAMKKYAGGVAKHRAAEGRVQQIEYKGDVAQAVQDILGGIRSACTYVGAASLKELTKRTTFVVKN